MKRISHRKKVNGLGARWAKVWLRFAGVSAPGRFFSYLSTLGFPPHKSRNRLAKLHPSGFLSHSAIFQVHDLAIGKNVLIDDDCLLYQRKSGGAIILHDRVSIYRSCILETGEGAAITIHPNVSIHPKCQVNALVSNIIIEEGVMLAPACALYSYSHSFEPGIPIRNQPLSSDGDIIIRKEAWLGYGVIVTSGVEIGEGAVIGGGSVVTKSIPANAIAVGNPARVVGSRE